MNKIERILLGEKFKNSEVNGWIQTIYYYVIDSKYRKSKRLNKFLSEQLTNPPPELRILAYNLRKGDIDETIINVLRWVKKNIKYSYDHEQYGKTEYWATATETITNKKGDCLKWDTKLLISKGKYLNIEDIQVNDLIIGKDGRAVKVLNKIDKGKLSTFKILLSNNTEIICTDEHKFILVDDSEVLMKDLTIGAKLKQNKYILIDSIDKKSSDYWYLKGLFIADGWTDNCHKDIFISGLDGCKKESQKEWVKNYCEKNNITYRWDKKSIAVHSKELYEDFKNCGTHAINKHLDNFPSTEENILSLLEGLKADAFVRIDGHVTFGTIGTQLKNDIKQLYRMIGVSCYEKLVQPTRTQFGSNPVWRIYPRLKKDKVLTVKGIIKNVDEQVYDITVENSEIYLPENDCVVHNCDDMNSLIYILARLSGIGHSVLDCAIGTVKTFNGSGGHYWTLYYSPRHQKVVSVDATYHPSTWSVKNRPRFKLSNDKYMNIWYMFNEEYVLRAK